MSSTTSQHERQDPAPAIDLRKFLERFRPDGPTTMVAIVPDGRTVAKTFNGASPAAAITWINQHNSSRNIYYTLQQTSPDLRKKPTKTQLTFICGCHADIDPIDDREADPERHRLASLAAELAALPWPPTFVVASGHGIQPVWLLAEAVPVTPEQLTAIEAINRRIEASLGGHGTFNADRLLRLPGTVNHPNKKKKALGRGAVPARLLEAGWRRYAWTDLEALADHLEKHPPASAVRAPGPQTGNRVVGDAAGSDDLVELDLPPTCPPPLDEKSYADAMERFGPLVGDHYESQSERDLALVNAAIADDMRDLEVWALLRTDRLTHAPERYPHKTAAEHEAKVVTRRPYVADLLRRVRAEWYVPEISEAEMAAAGWGDAGNGGEAEPWRLASTAGAVEKAGKKGKAPGPVPGDGAKGETGAEPEPRTHRNSPGKMLARMNKEFAITWAGGKAVILREHLDIQFNRQAVDFVRKEDMTTFYANEYVDVSRADGQPKYKPLALWWLQHRQRRTYPTGIIFNPKHTQRGAFNLWRGFAVAPDPSGSCECYKQHLREVICSNNDEWFRWLWAWLAQLAQDPTRRPGTCVVQRGAEGVGKGLWVIYLGLIFGRHFVHVQGARQLVGNFNKHLADAVVVFGDEAFFAGNKDHVGVLKAIITEPVTMCEPKFHDAFPVANHKWLIIASNEDWVFPAGITARRPLMLDVATTRRGDTAHFDALGAEMKAGGPGRLLHELLAFDLATCATSGINLRDPPKTAALIEQKQMSMSGTDRFWEERLREGSLLPYQVAAYGEAGSDDTRTPDVQRRRWEDPVHRDRAWVHGQKLYQAYLEAARGLNERHPVGVEIFWSNLRRWLPDDGIHNLRFRPNGIKHESPLQFKGFPPLGRCRKLFEKVLGQAIDWDQGELEEDDLDEPSF